MPLHAQPSFAVPDETARVARAAFPRGNPYMLMRDMLGSLYQDSAYAALFSDLGRPGVPPGELNLVCVMQYAEGLTDRQAADAVRGRIDWKYALGKELTDPGFDYSVLSEYRDRLSQGGLEARLLDDMLAQFQAQGWVKAGGRQRTDATHVLAAIRLLNRLECVGETLRHALEVLAEVAPDWLRTQLQPGWVDRYGERWDSWRLPDGKAEREALGKTVGEDGHQLLAAIYAKEAPEWLRKVPAVQILRRVWGQQVLPARGPSALAQGAGTPSCRPPDYLSVRSRGALQHQARYAMAELQSAPDRNLRSGVAEPDHASGDHPRHDPGRSGDRSHSGRPEPERAVAWGTFGRRWLPRGRALGSQSTAGGGPVWACAFGYQLATASRARVCRVLLCHRLGGSGGGVPARQTQRGLVYQTGEGRSDDHPGAVCHKGLPEM